jgi:hypothetical protein
MKHAKLKLGIFFVLIMLFSFSCKVPADEIRAKMDLTVPVGSSKKEVIRFLETNSFTYLLNPEEMARRNNIKGERITAGREDRILFREALTRMEIIFDENGTLIEYKITTNYPATSF